MRDSVPPEMLLATAAAISFRILVPGVMMIVRQREGAAGKHVVIGMLWSASDPRSWRTYRIPGRSGGVRRSLSHMFCVGGVKCAISVRVGSSMISAKGEQPRKAYCPIVVRLGRRDHMNGQAAEPSSGRG